MRISCDVATDAWGIPEMVMAYSYEGKSCAFPRPSPCGRYVLHILADKATYPIHQKSSDVYILDLESKQVVWHDPVLEGVSEYTDLWPALDGLAYGFANRKRIFVFAPATRAVVVERDTEADFGPPPSHQGHASPPSNYDDEEDRNNPAPKGIARCAKLTKEPREPSKG